jgi:sulfatase maturation enzyme AslB (radical SAM superfamily)
MTIHAQPITFKQSNIFVSRKIIAKDEGILREERRDRAKRSSASMKRFTEDDLALEERLSTLLSFARSVRVIEYHLTNACNIRCEGCWFFQYNHDVESREVSNLSKLSMFVQRETNERKINTALLIGGEPTLFQDRIKVFVDRMRYVTVSSNGLKKLPLNSFENVAIGLTVFGGGPLDDKLRAVKPSGARFSGLFDTALQNYESDNRAFFVYALNEDGLSYVEDTVRRISKNGNRVSFNFYSKYGAKNPSALSHQKELLHEALRVKRLFPETVISEPYYINTIITGESHWGSFGYENCPSISVDHHAHKERLKNGNPYLPVFNTWSADLETVKFCCTSGDCTGCRDSQAVFSWLLVNLSEFLADKQSLLTWLDIAESYWSQFIWSPYHPLKTPHIDCQLAFGKTTN